MPEHTTEVWPDRPPRQPLRRDGGGLTFGHRDPVGWEAPVLARIREQEMAREGSVLNGVRTEGA